MCFKRVNQWRTESSSMHYRNDCLRGRYISLKETLENLSHCILWSYSVLRDESNASAVKDALYKI